MRPVTAGRTSTGRRIPPHAGGRRAERSRATTAKAQGQERLSWSTRPSPDPGPSLVPPAHPRHRTPWTRWPSGPTAHQTAAHLTGTHSWSSSPTQIQHGSRRSFLQHRSRDCFRSAQRDDHGSAARSHRCEPRWQNRFPHTPRVAMTWLTLWERLFSVKFDGQLSGHLKDRFTGRHLGVTIRPMRKGKSRFDRRPARRHLGRFSPSPRRLFPLPQRRVGGHLPRDAIRFGGEPAGAGEGTLRHRFPPCRYLRDHGPGVIRRTRPSRARGRHRPGVLGSGAGR